MRASIACPGKGTRVSRKLTIVRRYLQRLLVFDQERNSLGSGCHTEVAGSELFLERHCEGLVDGRRAI